MDDPGPVRGIERVGDLLRRRPAPPREVVGPSQAIVQRLTVHQLEHQRGDVAAVFEPVDGPDVRMIQRGQQSGFACEARHAIDVRRERRRQDLQRDVAPQLGVARTIHFAHPAGPEGTEDLVQAEAGAWRHSHRACADYSGRDGALQSAWNPLD